jgi:two-component system sensor histidine kinase HydH
LSLVIAVSILLRGRVRTVHLLFAAFAGDIGLWYLSQSLASLFNSWIFERFTGVLTLLLPQFALHLFAAMIPHEAERPSRLPRLAMLLAVPLVLLLLSPVQKHFLVRGFVFLHVFAFLTAGLVELWKRGAQSGSRATQRRVRLLVVLGALAALASVVDFVWFLGVGVTPPPVGAALSVVFLFVLAQAFAPRAIARRLRDVGASRCCHVCRHFDRGHFLRARYPGQVWHDVPERGSCSDRDPRAFRSSSRSGC